MAYQATIPKPTDRLNQSQADLLENFAQLKTLIDVNHGTFGAADQGKHFKVSLPEQSDSPGTDANEMALYTKEVGTATQMFLQREGLAAMGVDIDFTSLDTTTANGSTQLPSGIQLKFGRETTTGGTKVITYTTPFPTGIITAYATVTKLSSSLPLQPSIVTVAGISASIITIFSFNMSGVSNSGISFHWLAIGY